MAQKSASWSKVALLVLFCLSFSIAVLISDKKFTISYLNHDAIAPTQEYLSFVFGFASLPVVFSENEASHMRDVAWLLRGAVMLALLLGIVLVRTVKTNEWTFLANKALAVFAVIGFLGFLTPFNTVFRLFHLLFFPQGNWTFPVDSVLISFYPQNFFAWYALYWFIYAVFTAGVIRVFSRALVR